MPLPAFAIPALKWGVPAAASFFGSMFGRGGGGGDTDADADWNQLLKSTQQQAGESRAAGQRTTAMSMDALRPVLDYFNQLLGGDSQALLAATQPERARVIDQYDTARQAIQQFSPRGGGTNAALAQSRFQQASDLAGITSQARSAAATGAGTIASQLASIGLTQQQLASMDLNQVINAILSKQYMGTQQRGQNLAMLGDVGRTIGTIVGAVLTRGEGAKK